MTLFLMGTGGDGVITAGGLVLGAAARHGLVCHMTKSFGPQIRGGESAAWLQISPEPISSPPHGVEIMVVLSWRAHPQFRSQLVLAPGALVFQDSADATEPPEDLVDSAGQPVVPIRIPLREISQQETGGHMARNTVAVGALLGLLGLPQDPVRQALARRLGKRGAAVVDGNLRALDRGRALATEAPLAAHVRPLPVGDRREQLLLSGNDAVALGALYAGVDFFAGYPITPASEILINLAAELPGVGGSVIQAEDEIAAMTMVIGASFGGRKAMTATSGPGLSLKSEAIGLATLTETPCVIVNVQRGGPSTGLPTRTEQADLNLAVHGAHGDAPRVVLGAEDVRSCFDASVKAFYIAERYQTPVILVTDQLVAHRLETVPASAVGDGAGFTAVCRRSEPEANGQPYKRFELNGDPVTPMASPGMEGRIYQTSGIVHREDGSPSSDPEVHQVMSEKLAAKMQLLLEELGGTRLEGPADARQGFVAWGSTVGAALEAACDATAAGTPTSVLVVEMISPLPVEAIRDYLAGLDRVAVPELSFSAQFTRHMRAHGVPLEGALLLHRAGGRPFTGPELLATIQEAWT
jgi:2-oxoglutarate/2-oxoacid ferredoxin oxidoreductase subunit alpha